METWQNDWQKFMKYLGFKPATFRFMPFNSKLNWWGKVHWQIQNYDDLHRRREPATPKFL